MNGTLALIKALIPGAVVKVSPDYGTVSITIASIDNKLDQTMLNRLAAMDAADTLRIQRFLADPLLWYILHQEQES